jgi:hypothetical protein
MLPASYIYKRSRPRLIPASPDIVEHRLRVHAQGCVFQDTVQIACPCGEALVIACTSCGEPIWIAAPVYRQCQHVFDIVYGPNIPKWWVAP